MKELSISDLVINFKPIFKNSKLDYQVMAATDDDNPFCIFDVWYVAKSELWVWASKN